MKVIPIDIYNARIEDAPEIAQAHLEAWRSVYCGIIPFAHLEQMIARRGDAWWRRAIAQGTHVIIAKFDGVTAGYATVGMNRARTLPYEGEIYELYIRPEYQGIGLGKKLFNSARRALADYGLKNNVVWVLADNHSACQFSETMDGVLIARSTENFGNQTLKKYAYAWGV